MTNQRVCVRVFRRDKRATQRDQTYIRSQLLMRTVGVASINTNKKVETFNFIFERVVQ